MGHRTSVVRKTAVRQGLTKLWSPFVFDTGLEDLMGCCKPTQWSVGLQDCSSISTYDKNVTKYQPVGVRIRVFYAGVAIAISLSSGCYPERSPA